MPGRMLFDLLEPLKNPRVEEAIAAVPVELSPLGYDPWGYCPSEATLYYSLAFQIYRYFRPEVRGLENLPPGRVLIIGNHSGQLPFDGLVTAVACLLEARPPRLLRPMVERWFPTLPWVNEAFSRSGAVLGDPLNCRNLLEAENAILVFPEGVRGSGKLWFHRYRLVPFGRGFMRLALQTNTPIVPVGIVGGEESIISIANIAPLARLLRMPYFPVPALLPVLGLLSYLPLPVRFRLRFGEPMRFEGPFDDEDEVIDGKVRQVMARVQQIIDETLAERTGVFA
jgi:1-acyl-sn-glycerol-3-phosphate acyltransferase